MHSKSARLKTGHAYVCVCVGGGGVRGSYRKGNLNGSVLSINSLYKISTCEM